MDKRTVGTKREKLPRSVRTFAEWKKDFDLKLHGGSIASSGLTKWIAEEVASRKSLIAFTESRLRSLGSDTTWLKKLPQPQDTRADVLEHLYSESMPNLDKRSMAKKENDQLLEQMEGLATSLDQFVARLKRQRAPHIITQDRFFPIPLGKLLPGCEKLASAMRTISNQARRENIGPIDIADCCMALILELEDALGLSQRECHALIKCALLSHGCDEEEEKEVDRFFDQKNIKGGTVRRKKVAIRNKFLDSANVLGIDIADSCVAFLLELEDRLGLSPKEWHALIECVLLSHGCDEKEVGRFFDEKNIKRGTIILNKVLESANANFLKGLGYKTVNAT